MSRAKRRSSFRRRKKLKHRSFFSFFPLASGVAFIGFIRLLTLFGRYEERPTVVIAPPGLPHHCNTAPPRLSPCAHLHCQHFCESVTADHLQTCPIHAAPAATDSFYCPRCTPQDHSCCASTHFCCKPPPCKKCPKAAPLFLPLAPCVLTPTFRHVSPEGIGYAHGYTSMEQLLFPLRLRYNLWPFLDFRMHIFDDGELAANAGVGFRYLPCETSLAFGLNAYYDFRETAHRTRFSQIGLGFEILSDCWDFRINAYLPIEEKKLLRRCFWTFPGGFFIERKRYEEAKRGFNLELGSRFASFDLFHTCDWLQFYGAIGPYYYKGECRRILGGKFRLRMDISRHISIEGIVSRDDFYKTRAQLQLSLRFPLGCNSCNKRGERVLSQSVERQEIIAVEEFCKWRWNF